MGFGMPGAVGAYFANPGSKIIVIDGDGSFRMNMGELHTIGTYNLPIKILLLNNMSDGMVHNLEDHMYGGRHSATERHCDVNYTQMAKSCKFMFAKRISDNSMLKTELKKFLAAKGPSFLEVITDPAEKIYPVVRSGASYRDMDLGPYIKKRGDI
jgi:acetolactate synthase-1/2/3 large subunit